MANPPNSTLSATLASLAQAAYVLSERLLDAQRTLGRAAEQQRCDHPPDDGGPIRRNRAVDYEGAVFAPGGSSAVTAWATHFSERYDMTDDVRLGWGLHTDKLQFFASVHFCTPVPPGQLEVLFPEVTLQRALPDHLEKTSTARLARGVPLFLTLLRGLHQATQRDPTPGSLAPHILSIHVFARLAEVYWAELQTRPNATSLNVQQFDISPFEDTLVWGLQGGIQPGPNAAKTALWFFDQDRQRFAGHKGAPRNTKELETKIVTSLNWFTNKVWIITAAYGITPNPTSPEPRSSTHPEVFHDS
ncbi:hypothetical protein JCM11641_003400 [Rhodosporidiobolus odoratus]